MKALKEFDGLVIHAKKKHIRSKGYCLQKSFWITERITCRDTLTLPHHALCGLASPLS